MEIGHKNRWDPSEKARETIILYYAKKGGKDLLKR